MTNNTPSTDDLSQALNQLEAPDAPLLSDSAMRVLLITALREIIALRVEMNVLHATVDSQDQFISQFLGQQSRRSYAGHASQAPIQPPMQRSLEYWSTNVPDFGDNLTQDEIQRHLAKPRKQVDASLITIAPTQAPAWRARRKFEKWPDLLSFRRMAIVVLILCGFVGLVWLRFFFH